MKRYCIPAVAAAVVMLLSGCGVSRAFDPDSQIVVASREEGSGTRGAFTTLTGVAAQENGQTLDRTTAEALVTNSTAVMMTTVAGNPQAVGYVSLGSLNDTVKAVRIDGAAPTVDNIRRGQYALARPFLLAAREDLSAPAADFQRFILSEEGQAVVEASGYVPVENAPLYAPEEVEGRVVAAGSSSLTPVMEKLKEAYRQWQPDVTVEVQQSDTTTGLASARNSLCDLAMASRELTAEETEGGLTATVIARDGIAVIVSLDNPVDSLTVAQVRGIFTGTLTTWNGIAG